MVGTVMVLVYIGVFIYLAYNRPIAAAIWAVIGFMVILIYSCCCISGDAAQREEDDFGIRRS